MSDLLPAIAAYIPQSLTRTVLADPSPTLPAAPQTTRMQAAVLFADVSGFTPLTEALGQKGSEGPEELTRLLNRYLSWMISFVEAEGGEVIKFGGDSLTVVFPAIDEALSLATRRAMQAAEAMQSAMADFGIMESSAGVVTLKMKFGIGAGEVLMTQVGGFFNRWEFIMAGDALRQATQSENQAEQGQIILSKEAEAIIAQQALPPKALPPLDWTSVKNLTDAETVLRNYIPGSVRSWLDGELHDWLATLRPMSVMFVSIKGLDYEQPDTIDKLHALLRDMQRIIYHYWGTLTRVTVDDKGTVLLILFGAPPYSHEDDTERALRCALDLQTLTAGKELQLAIGVTAGRVFAGPVGGHTRREYTVMADAVNLAARLMVAAGPGKICCNHEAYRSTYDKLNFETLPAMKVKGKAGLISVYRPIGRYDPTQLSQIWRPQQAKEPIVGREAELARLTTSLKETQAGQSRIIIIEGEAGIGKSRLVEAWVELTQDHDMKILLGMGLSIEQEKPYHAWRGIFAAYFGLDNRNDNSKDLWQAEQQRRVQAQVREVAPDLIEYLPLLNDIFNLELPENEFTTSLDEASREENLSLLLLTLLQSWTIEKPLVLILEDAHWLDLSSWKLAIQLAATVITNNLPLLLILVTRPLENVTMRTQATMLAALDETEYLRLDSLSGDGTLTLATRRMGLTAPELPETVAELVRTRAGGNPYFAEELFYTLHDNGYITFKEIQGRIRCLVSDDLDRAAQALPATIQSIILSRIDQLPPEKQLILRVAAVIGQMFAYTALHNTLCKHLETPAELLNDYLNDLIYLDLIRPVNSESNLYEFKHVIIREVAYQSLLFDRRRQLHRTVALWYENTYSPEANGTFPAFESEVKTNLSFTTTSPSLSTPLAPYYALLVYHWHQAEDDARELHYATLIGEQAVAQFANAEALGYLNRALDLAQDSDIETQYKLLLARETVYDRFGTREVQNQDLLTLAELVKKTKDTQHNIEIALRQANYAEAIGDYATALEAAQQAVAQAKRLQDPISESKGHIIWGTILLQQSNYTTAQKILEQALTLAQANHHRYNEANSLYSLAVLHCLQGDYPAAQENGQLALTICQSNNYRLIQARTLNILGLIHFRLGDYPVAQDHFEQSILIYHTIGDRRGESKPFGNIGLICLKLGDYEAARDYFEETLNIQREVNDRAGIAETLSNLGIVYCCLGEYNAARSYLGNSLEIHKEIGDENGEANTLSKFGFVYHSLGDYPTTKRYCELALAIQQRVGNREAESKSLTLLGHALTGLEQSQAAADAYDKALRLRRAMGQAGLVLEILAGQAYIAMKQDNMSQALTMIDELLAWIEASDDRTSIANPLWVYWTSYKILNIAAQNTSSVTERAQIVLAAAYSILQEWAARLSDETLRHKFMNGVKINQEIIAVWEQKARLPQKSKQSRDKSKQSKPLINDGT